MKLYFLGHIQNDKLKLVQDLDIILTCQLMPQLYIPFLFFNIVVVFFVIISILSEICLKTFFQGRTNFSSFLFLVCLGFFLNFLPRQNNA